MEEGTSETMFSSCQEVVEYDSTYLWLLDSGYNNHMTSNKSLFSSFKDSIKRKIKLRDDHLVDVHETKTTPILSKQNEKKDILEVYYANGLKYNPISVGQLSQHGYEVTFKGPTCTILDKLCNK